jgi:hypothetical protein
VVPADPAVDVLEQLVALLNWNAALKDPSVASLVKLPFDNVKGLSAAREPSSLCSVGREHLTEEVIEVRLSPVGRNVGLHR